MRNIETKIKNLRSVQGAICVHFYVNLTTLNIYYLFIGEDLYRIQSFQMSYQSLQICIEKMFQNNMFYYSWLYKIHLYLFLQKSLFLQVRLNPFSLFKYFMILDWLIYLNTCILDLFSKIQQFENISCVFCVKGRLAL